MERLRCLLVRHLEALNPKVTLGQLDALEKDIKTFVKFALNSVKELGLVVECESFIGDFELGSR